MSYNPLLTLLYLAPEQRYTCT